MRTVNYPKNELKIIKKELPFPACAKDCEIVKLLGCCECEYCCPHKFDKDGNPIDIK